MLAISAPEALMPRTGECERLLDAEMRRADLGSFFYERWAAQRAAIGSVRRLWRSAARM